MWLKDQLIIELTKNTGLGVFTSFLCSLKMGVLGFGEYNGYIFHRVLNNRFSKIF